MTIPVNYTIKLVDDLETIFEDNCSEYQMPKEIIRISIREDNKENKISNLTELPDGVIDQTKIDPLGQKEYTIRVWTTQDTTIQAGSTRHYHGKIQIVEDDSQVAILDIKERK